MQRGDHIKIWRFRTTGLPYSHHGVYVGSGRVIHYTGEFGRKRNARVVETSLSSFLDGQRQDQIRVVRHSPRHSTETVIRRARSRIGEADYSLVFKNCEHFATWCVTGDARSNQTKAGAAIVVALSFLVGTSRSP